MENYKKEFMPVNSPGHQSSMGGYKGLDGQTYKSYADYRRNSQQHMNKLYSSKRVQEES